MNVWERQSGQNVLGWVDEATAAHHETELAVGLDRAR